LSGFVEPLGSSQEYLFFEAWGLTITRL